MLSEDQLEELFNGVLHVLENIGLEVKNEESREVLEEAGAWVDNNLVRLPSHMVIDALTKAPRSFTIYARDGNEEHNIQIGPGRAHFGPGPTFPNFIDVETTERRPYVLTDVPVVAKVVDSLSNIDSCESLGSVDDVPYDLSALYEFVEMFRHTTKFIVAWSFDYYDSNTIHKIAVKEASGQEAFERRPNYVHYCEPLSPLISTDEAFNKLVFASKKRIPTVFKPCPLAGGTAPITPAGIIIQAVAESWMGLTIAQNIQPGLPPPLQNWYIGSCSGRSMMRAGSPPAKWRSSTCWKKGPGLSKSY
jgi:trimethylamine--corrinoid protein Co-methyltransferase